MPITAPPPAAQMRAISARTRVLPEPAGALITDTSRPSARAASAAAAWSSRSPLAVFPSGVWRASCARPVSASSSCARSAPSACAACARVMRGALVALAWASMLVFHGELGAGGVAGAAVALVDAAAVGAAQAGRDLGGFGGFQAQDGLELGAQGAVGQVLEERGGFGGVAAGAGQDAAEVLDHVGAGPGGLFLLRERDGFLRRAGQLEVDGRRAVRAGRARVCVTASAVPDRWRDRRQRDAEGTRELVRPALVQLRDVERGGLRLARAEVGGLREVRELALGRRAAIGLLEPRGAGAQVGGDGLAAGGEQAHHLRR